MRLALAKVLEWTAFAVLLIGVYLTARNAYPANIYVSLAGNALWMALAIVWRKWSLILTQLVISAVYLTAVLWPAA